MPQMTHCHQCRADAIGMLGEDRSQQFTQLPAPESLPAWLPILHQRAQLHASIATRGESEADDACLVAVASSRGDVIDCHFGHTDRFSIYSLSAAGMVLVNERFTPNRKALNRALTARGGRSPKCCPRGGSSAGGAGLPRYRIRGSPDAAARLAAALMAAVPRGERQLSAAHGA